jgi:hypothetical protein
MTPKEKAKELYDKYWTLIAYKIEGSVGRLVIKQCALIAVDELLWEFEFALSRDKSDLFLQDKVKWFTEVKQEIENL